MNPNSRLGAEVGKAIQTVMRVAYHEDHVLIMEEPAVSTRMIIFVSVGLALLGTVVLRRLVGRLPISLPLVCVCAGFAIFALPTGMPAIAPVGNEQHGTAIEYLTEFAVIVSLLGTGLSIDRPFSFTRKSTRQCGWLQVWPLLGITMPLTILSLALLGYYWLGLGLGAAVLLGAVLSPTDPVLARSVQVGPPGDEERNDVRFNLTAEAGLNDGLAFPFTYLAMGLALVAGGESFAGVIGEWVLVDVLWRCFAGTLVGFLLGRLTAAVINREAERSEGEESLKAMGVIAFGTLFAAYGIAEMIEGYGFIAVFVGAVTVRHFEPDTDHPYHAHRFVDQVEKIVLVMLLLGLGAFVASGALNALTLSGALVGVIVVLVLRPLFGWIAMKVGPSSDVPALGRFIVAFAGIRGLGTLYYLAYAGNRSQMEGLEEVWSVCLFTILLSIVLHGATVPTLVSRAEKTDSMAIRGDETPS